MERANVLNFLEKSRTLKHYRHILNKLQSLGDFVIDVSVELLRHASRIASNDELNEHFFVSAEPTSDEGKRLVSLRKKKMEQSDFHVL